MEVKDGGTYNVKSGKPHLVVIINIDLIQVNAWALSHM